MNSPVTASKPTWIVCSKSEGEEISGLSLSRSFFLPPVGEVKGQRVLSSTAMSGLSAPTFLRGKDGDDLVLGLPFLGHGRQRARTVIGRLRLLRTSSLAAHPDRGGGGLVLTHNAVTHLHRRAPVRRTVEFKIELNKHREVNKKRTPSRQS